MLLRTPLQTNNSLVERIMHTSLERGYTCDGTTKQLSISTPVSALPIHAGRCREKGVIVDCMYVFGMYEQASNKYKGDEGISHGNHTWRPRQRKEKQIPQLQLCNAMQEAHKDARMLFETSKTRRSDHFCASLRSLGALSYCRSVSICSSTQSFQTGVLTKSPTAQSDLHCTTNRRPSPRSPTTHTATIQDGPALDP